MAKKDIFGGDVEIEKPIFEHVGMMVKDAEKLLELMKQLPSARNYKLHRMHFTEEMIEIGGTFELKMAFIEIGDINYELIELINGPGSYFDEWWRNNGCEGLHHICYAFPNHYEKVLAKLINDGYKIVLKGKGDFHLNYVEAPYGGALFEIHKEIVNL